MKFFVRTVYYLSIIFLLAACGASRRSAAVTTYSKPVIKEHPSSAGKKIIIDTKKTDPASVVYFAKTLIGTPYKYGSVVKEQGFDCSGFITYVFNHFNIQVPRVSKDFTNAGTNISLNESKKGDLILFTGSDTTGWIVGHMGMITENENGVVKFIHSSSGKSIGVIISSLSNYYALHFVKVIRIFE